MANHWTAGAVLGISGTLIVEQVFNGGTLHIDQDGPPATSRDVQFTALSSSYGISLPYSYWPA